MYVVSFKWRLYPFFVFLFLFLFFLVCGFGSCFFLLFSVSKNNFLFLRFKNLFGNSKCKKKKKKPFSKFNL